MKHRVSTILIVLSLLLALVSIAATPMPAGTAVLTGVQYVPGKGPVFTFNVSGDFSKSDLTGGTVYVEGGGSYDLYCVQVDASTVKCTAPKAVAGHSVSVTWGGSSAWTSVPGAWQYCYSIYDWPYPSNSGTEWVNYGSYCQDDPAQYGDVFMWYNPVWGYAYDYEFMPESPNEKGCPYDQKVLDAFYYPSCIY